MKNRNSKLLKNTALMFIGNFGSKLLAFILVPLYTSVLTTSEYGIADLIFTTVTLIAPVFTLAIYESMLRFALDEKIDKTAVLRSGTIVCGIGFLLFLLISPCFLFVSKLRDYYIYFILYYFVYTIYHCMSYYVRGIGKTIAYSIAGFTNAGLLILFNILFLLQFKMGIEGYLLASICSNAISSVVAFAIGRTWKYVSFKQIVIKDLLKAMLLYSVPLIPNAISWWISDSSDRYILTLFCGVASCGVYSVAYKIPSILNAIATIVNAAWQLSSVDEFGSEESKSTFSEIYNIFLTSLIITSGCIILCAKPFASILFKADFYDAWRFVPILSIAVVLHGMGGFVGTVFTASKKTKSLLTTTLAGAVLNIVLNFLLIPKFGGTGAAIATLISYLLVFILRIIMSRKYIIFDINIKATVSVLFLICIEAMAVCTEIKGGLIIEVVCLLLIVLINMKTIINVIKGIKNMFIKRSSSRTNVI